MIDCHLGEQGAGLRMDPNQSTICVMGLGQAGINIVDQIVLHGMEPIFSVAVDTDQSVIEGSVAKEKLLLGCRVARGIGCTGDVLRGRQIWKAEAASMERCMRAHREIIITVGLGGGTGSAFVVEAIKMAKAAGIRSLVVCTIPFSFETTQRHEVARKTLEEIRGVADSVMILSNDRALPWPCSRDNIRHSFHVLNQLLAQGVESLAQIISARGLTPLEVADVQIMFGCSHQEEMGENFWIGSCEAESEEGMEELVQGVMESPLLADRSSWQSVDACLACLVGGRDLSLTSLQQLSKTLEKRLGGQMKIRLGAKLDENHPGQMKLTLLMASTRECLASPPPAPVPLSLPEPITSASIGSDSVPPKIEVSVEDVTEVPVPSLKTKLSIQKPIKTKPKLEPVVDEELLPVSMISSDEPERVVVPRQISVAAKRKPSKQEELPFDNNRGRFDKSYETIYRGENIDQPTFRRRNLTIKV